ncbi:Proliferation marker protein Ki-67 [Galemys pyrenaicus]|uniref:Proliferation marker protein Ki-67 n=1 Tax=Galemys pyrenaicus TaxID=202257 RepID=A0A8J6AHQ8_GALPY|nr:Proliferation marker protein Ki-67 [Galemys pyrenaicus]
MRARGSRPGNPPRERLPREGICELGMRCRLQQQGPLPVPRAPRPAGFEEMRKLPLALLPAAFSSPRLTPHGIFQTVAQRAHCPLSDVSCAALAPQTKLLWGNELALRHRPDISCTSSGPRAIPLRAGPFQPGRCWPALVSPSPEELPQGAHSRERTSEAGAAEADTGTALSAWSLDSPAVGHTAARAPTPRPSPPAAVERRWPGDSVGGLQPKGLSATSERRTCSLASGTKAPLQVGTTEASKGKLPQSRTGLSPAISGSLAGSRFSDALERPQGARAALTPERSLLDAGRGGGRRRRGADCCRRRAGRAATPVSRPVGHPRLFRSLSAVRLPESTLLALWCPPPWRRRWTLAWKMGSTGRIVTIKRSGADGPHFPLSLSSCLFGRSVDSFEFRAIECDIRIQLPVVSKQHCKIETNKQEVLTNGPPFSYAQVTLTNYSSTNPTLVNGSAIEGAVPLRHGDVITIVDRSFR